MPLVAVETRPVFWVPRSLGVLLCASSSTTTCMDHTLEPWMFLSNLLHSMDLKQSGQKASTKATSGCLVKWQFPKCTPTTRWDMDVFMILKLDPRFPKILLQMPLIITYFNYIYQHMKYLIGWVWGYSWSWICWRHCSGWCHNFTPAVWELTK